MSTKLIRGASVWADRNGKYDRGWIKAIVERQGQLQITVRFKDGHEVQHTMPAEMPAPKKGERLPVVPMCSSEEIGAAGKRHVRETAREVDATMERARKFARGEE